MIVSTRRWLMRWARVTGGGIRAIACESGEQHPGRQASLTPSGARRSIRPSGWRAPEVGRRHRPREVEQRIGDPVLGVAHAAELGLEGRGGRRNIAPRVAGDAKGLRHGVMVSRRQRSAWSNTVMDHAEKRRIARLPRQGRENARLGACHIAHATTCCAVPTWDQSPIDRRVMERVP